MRSKLGPGWLILALIAGCASRGHAVDDAGPGDDAGCVHDCAPAVCGDGTRDPGEACDDGNTVDGDGCDHDCSVTACGNGIVTTGEACDDGNAVDGDACERDCTAPACGNGIVDRDETCDDGNAIEGDGCDARCQLAPCTTEVPVAPGRGSALTVAGKLEALVADPRGCLIYALDTGAPSHLVVISAASKRELTRLALPQVASSLATLVVGNDDALTLARIALDPLRFERFVPTPRYPARLAGVGGGRVATTDPRGFPTLLDAGTGSVISQVAQVFFGSALGATADGSSVFVGQASPNYGDLYRYSLATGALVAADRSHYMTFGFFDAERSVTVVPDGSGVYYARHFLDGHDLGRVPYEVDGPILAVSPDSHLALSATSLYDVATGARLGAVPAAVAVAVSPDSATAFAALATGIQRIDLTRFAR